MKLVYNWPIKDQILEWNLLQEVHLFSVQHTFIDYHPSHIVKAQGDTMSKRIFSVIIEQIEKNVGKVAGKRSRVMSLW